MPTESIAAAKWLYAQLAADPELASLVQGRIYAYRVPADQPMPAVVFQLLSAPADIRVTGARVAARLRFSAKGIGEGPDFLAIKPIAQRIDALLEAQSGSNADGVVAYCYRETPLEYLETTDEGRDFAHLGGTYWLTVQGT